jgi:hypothetical protein
MTYKGGAGAEGRPSFLKKRSKKLLRLGTRACRLVRDSVIKVFCFFSSEKKTFPCSAAQAS